MTKKTKLSITVLNLYTISLIGMFLLFQNQNRAVLFILFLIFINIAVFTVIVLSNKKEISEQYSLSTKYAVSCTRLYSLRFAGKPG